jgi:tRNA(Arg) A34 adenosine deaminase TadA
MEELAGGPFGAIIVKDGEVVGRGNNQVTRHHDPTAHAEVEAIRDACRNLGSHQLEGCTIYSSCEPCPMCLGAIYWARPDALYYGASKKHASDAGFDDAFIYIELEKDSSERKLKTQQIMKKKAKAVLMEWKFKAEKIPY